MAKRRQHQPGDRWRHETWPREAPDAVVKSVSVGGRFDLVTWAHRGGGQYPNILAWNLSPKFGWHRQTVDPEKVAEDST